LARQLRIVARTNRVGMDRDVRLLAEALSARGTPPIFSHYRSISPLRRFFGRPRADETLIFLERVTARWLRTAGRYVLVPNQERFAPRLVPLLARMEHILCKTEHAREIFAALHPSVHLIGFTSEDRALPGVVPDYGRFFHLAGGSSLKGTADLVELWRRHPEWPPLTLVQHRRGAAPGSLPANVERIERYLSDAELRALQNACGVHLCPSRSEGWGHYIVEAMSCGAVTLTTDAPPMNELVEPERGVLVPWDRREPRKLGYDFFADVPALERAIADLIARSSAEKAALGGAARAWFEANDAAFRRRLDRAAGALL
jgi:glycosyltransferase involved in cell wall biosynthesis